MDTFTCFFPFDSTLDREYIHNILKMTLEANTLVSLTSDLEQSVLVSLILANFALNTERKVIYLSTASKNLEIALNTCKTNLPSAFKNAFLLDGNTFQRNRRAHLKNRQILFYSVEAFYNDFCKKPSEFEPALVLLENCLINRENKPLSSILAKLSVEHTRIVTFVSPSMLNISKFSKYTGFFKSEQSCLVTKKDEDVAKYIFPKKIVFVPYLTDEGIWKFELISLVEEVCKRIKHGLLSSKLVKNKVRLDLNDIKRTYKEIVSKRGIQSEEGKLVYLCILMLEQLSKLKLKLKIIEKNELLSVLDQMKYNILGEIGKMGNFSDQQIKNAYRAEEFDCLLEFGSRIVSNSSLGDPFIYALERVKIENQTVILEKREEEAKKIGNVLSEKGLKVVLVSANKQVDSALLAVEAFKKAEFDVLISDDLNLVPLRLVKKIIVTEPSVQLNNVLSLFDRECFLGGEIVFVVPEGKIHRSLVREREVELSSVYDSKMEQLRKFEQKLEPAFKVNLRKEAKIEIFEFSETKRIKIKEREKTVMKEYLAESLGKIELSGEGLSSPFLQKQSLFSNESELEVVLSRKRLFENN